MSAKAGLISLKERADKRHISLELQGEALFLTANERMIDELLYNLVDNAIKYNIDNGSVRVTLKEEDGECAISGEFAESASDPNDMGSGTGFLQMAQ